jgi:hypothetical protein
MYYLILDLWKVSIQQLKIKKDINDLYQMINQIHDMKKDNTNMPVRSIEIDGMQEYLIGSISIIIERKKDLFTECGKKYEEILCKIKEEIDDIKKQELNYIDNIEIKIDYNIVRDNLTKFLEEEDSRITLLLIKDKPIILEDDDFERIKHAIKKSVNP